MTKYARHSMKLIDKYKDMDVCFNCAGVELDSNGRLYCVNTKSKDCGDFVPNEYSCKCYKRRKGGYRAK